MSERRLHWQIYLDMVWAITDSRKKPVKLTPLGISCGISYDKCKGHISLLEQLGILKIEPEIKLTEKGRDFMDKFGQVQYTINILEEHFLKLKL